MSKTKLHKGNLIIEMDISDILKSLSEDGINDLIEALSCDSRVIKNVSDQIVHGCTEQGWHGGKTFSAEPSSALDKAIREVANNASDVAKEEIDSLKRKVKYKDDKIDELYSEIRELKDKLYRP